LRLQQKKNSTSDAEFSIINILVLLIIFKMKSVFLVFEKCLGVFLTRVKNEDNKSCGVKSDLFLELKFNLFTERTVIFNSIKSEINFRFFKSLHRLLNNWVPLKKKLYADLLKSDNVTISFQLSTHFLSCLLVKLLLLHKVCTYSGRRQPAFVNQPVLLTLGHRHHHAPVSEFVARRK